jgi:tetratricopeptide (TPR) repeat protein
MAIERTLDCEGAYWTLGQAYFASDRLEEAAAVAARAIEVSGSDYNVYIPFIHIMERLGQNESAVQFRQQGMRALERQLELVPEDARARVLLAADYVHFRREPEALRELQIALALRPKDSNILYNAACVYGLLGNKDEALAVLKKAREAGYSLLITWAARDPDLACLHGEPEFLHLLEEGKQKG